MTLDRFSVAGQTAVVTGASSGIGRAIAEQFAADGADVVICSREQENVDPVADEINQRDDDGGRALAVECDVTERDAVEALVEATVEEFGTVDCLVNNAGASFMASFDDISENGWRTSSTSISRAPTTARRSPASTSRTAAARSSTSRVSPARRARRT